MRIAVLQARFSSTRLPGKVMLPLGGTSILEAQMLRVQESHLDEFWLATSDRPDDDPVSDVGKKLGWRVFRGSLSNVQSRFETIAEMVQPEVMVRLTGDNPFMNYQMINSALDQFSALDSVQWLGDVGGNIPLGLAPEVFDVDAFRYWASQSLSEHLQQRVHVTTGLRTHGLAVGFVAPFEGLNSSWRLTIDTERDLLMARKLVESLGAGWITSSMNEIRFALEARPHISLINRGVVQKKWSEG